jgi:hypothetical protein
MHHILGSRIQSRSRVNSRIRILIEVKSWIWISIKVKIEELWRLETVPGRLKIETWRVSRLEICITLRRNIRNDSESASK